jgi:hypothetical protein
MRATISSRSHNRWRLGTSPAGHGGAYQRVYFEGPLAA